MGIDGPIVGSLTQGGEVPDSRQRQPHQLHDALASWASCQPRTGARGGARSSPAPVSRVRVDGAQSYRPFGTAAELVVVPSEQAVHLPEQARHHTAYATRTGRPDFPFWRMLSDNVTIRCPRWAGLARHARQESLGKGTPVFA